MAHIIRQLEERHVSIEIKILRWNDRMDLLALANIKGLFINITYKLIFLFSLCYLINNTMKTKIFN